MANRLLPEEAELGIYEDDGSGSSNGSVVEGAGGDGTLAERKYCVDAEAEVARKITSSLLPQQTEKAPDSSGAETSAATDSGHRLISHASPRSQCWPPGASESSGAVEGAHGASPLARRKRKSGAPSNSTGVREGHDGADGKANVLVTAALEVLNQRCVSVVKQKAPFYETARAPLASQRFVKYVSVNQSVPLPMEPLKAWKGYNGNLYFEPISIKPAGIGSGVDGGHETTDGTDAVANAPSKSSSSSPRTAAAAARTASTRHGGGGGRAGGGDGGGGGGGGGGDDVDPEERDLVFRQMSLLDKRSVMTRRNRHLHEDLAWIRGQEAVGSLIEAAAPGDKACERDKYRPERIRKGSVVRSAAAATAPSGGEVSRGTSSSPSPRPTQPPRGAGGDDGGRRRRAASVAVSGARLHGPLYMSPLLLRATTQYSQSTQRLAASSPETYNASGSYDRLPPLEQLRASLRHRRGGGGGVAAGGRRVATVSDKPLAYVKYSRDVKIYY